MYSFLGFFKRFLILFVLVACQENNNQNTYVPMVPVDFQINLNLPEGYPLLVNGGYAVFNGIGQGYRGVLVYRRTADQYKAFDLTCPHLPVNLCTQPITVDWPLLKCDCEDEEVSFHVESPYASYNGELFFLKEYQVRVLPNNQLRVFN